MITEEELKELEQKAILAASRECMAFKDVLLNMIFDYSKTSIEPSELKGMVRLLANTRDWDKQYEKKLQELKELKK